MRDPPTLERARQHNAHVVLPDQVGEDLRPVLEGEGAMGHETPGNAKGQGTSGTPERLLTAATFRS